MLKGINSTRMLINVAEGAAVSSSSNNSDSPFTILGSLKVLRRCRKRKTCGVRSDRKRLIANSSRRMKMRDDAKDIGR
jgi:hypothetical protein